MKKIILAILLCSSPAMATVTTSDRSQSEACAAAPGTTVFTIDEFPFLLCSDLKVIKITTATLAEATLTAGTNYSCKVPVGSVKGYITLTAACDGATHSIRIDRLVPLTQTTSFKTAGRYNAAAHEAAFDKLTMEVQQISLGTVVSTDITDAIDTHSAAANPHTGYHLTAGLAGGQYATGGTLASQNLTLRSTAHATKGKIFFGADSAYDETGPTLGLNKTTVDTAYVLHLGGPVLVDGTVDLDIREPDTAGNLSGIGAFLGTSLSLDLIGWDTAGTVVGARLSLYGPNHSTKPSWTEARSNDFYIYNTSSHQNFRATTGSAYFDGNVYVDVGSDGMIYGSDTAAMDLTLKSNSVSATGYVYVGSTSGLVYEVASGEVGIGTGTPGTTLDVQGSITGKRKFEEIQTNTLIDVTTDCNRVFLDNKGSATSHTLPDAAASQGCMFTLINGVDGIRNVDIHPDGSDYISGSCVSSTAGATTAVLFPETDGRGMRLTCVAGTHGEYVTLVAAGADWYIIGCSGAWSDIP